MFEAVGSSYKLPDASVSAATVAILTHRLPIKGIHCFEEDKVVNYAQAYILTD